MAGKEISVKKYVVKLRGEEREQLEVLIRKGKGPARSLLKAFRNDACSQDRFRSPLDLQKQPPAAATRGRTSTAGTP